MFDYWCLVKNCFNLDQDDPVLEVNIGVNVINDDNILKYGPEHEYRMEYPILEIQGALRPNF